MTAQSQEKKIMTQAEYLEMERTSLNIKHEFYDGEIFAMAGAGRTHNEISSNFVGELRNQFKAKNSGCKAVSSDLRVKIENNYTYPDVVVYCRDAEFEDAKLDILKNPVVIIEILSDSTEAFDRGDKFEYYKAIPSLQEYILVSQKKHWVGQFTRKDSGKWEYGSYQSMDQVLKMESIDCELPLSEIYWGVDPIDAESK